MEILKFGKEMAQEISNYNTISSYYSKLMKTGSPTNIGFIFIEKGGIVGYHKAPVPQLFLVIEGKPFRMVLKVQFSKRLDIII